MVSFEGGRGLSHGALSQRDVCICINPAKADGRHRCKHRCGQASCEALHILRRNWRGVHRVWRLGGGWGAAVGGGWRARGGGHLQQSIDLGEVGECLHVHHRGSHRGVLRAQGLSSTRARSVSFHTLLHSPPLSAQRHTRENQRTRQHPVAEPYPHLTTLPHSAHARPLHPQISIGAPLCGQHTASRTRWCAPNLYASPICGDVVGLSSPPDGPTGRKCLRTAKEELQRVLGSLQTHVALHQQRAGDHLVRAGVESNVFRCLRGRWSSLHDACRHGQPIRILSVTERGGSVPCVRHRR